MHVSLGVGGQGVRITLKNIGFLSNTEPERLENHKATDPKFNVGAPLACLPNDI